MRIDRFGHGVAFAAIAGLGIMGWQLATSPVLHDAALPLGLTLLALAWLFGLARSAASGFKLLLGAGPLALLVALVTGDLLITAVMLTVIIGVARGVFITGHSAGRAVLIEALTGVSALALAGFLLSGGLLSLGLATWGYFLVQSCAMLPGGARQAKASAVDPFEAAHARASQLLDAL